MYRAPTNKIQLKTKITKHAQPTPPRNSWQKCSLKKRVRQANGRKKIIKWYNYLFPVILIVSSKHKYHTYLNLTIRLKTS